MIRTFRTVYYILIQIRKAITVEFQREHKDMDKQKAMKWHCSVEATLGVLGGKYKAIIVWHLKRAGVMRFSELQKAISQATAKMLIQ